MCLIVKIYSYNISYNTSLLTHFIKKRNNTYKISVNRTVIKYEAFEEPKFFYSFLTNSQQIQFFSLPMACLFFVSLFYRKQGTGGGGRGVMGKKYRLLGCFVGNAETGTVVPVLDPFQVTLKFFPVEKLETSSAAIVHANFSSERRPLKFDLVSKLDAAALMYDI